jgi:hypothetical protein
MEILETIKTPKNAEKYCCNLCYFICSKLSDYNRHLLTAKHIRKQNGNIITPKNAYTEFFCECGKPSIVMMKQKRIKT